MKNCALILITLFVSLTSFSQQAELNLIGLTNDQDATKIILLKASPADASSYTLEKTADASSKHLQTAIQNATIFDSAYLTLTAPNGNITTTKLIRVTLRDFEMVADNGQTTERFSLHFQQEITMH